MAALIFILIGFFTVPAVVVFTMLGMSMAHGVLMWRNTWFALLVPPVVVIGGVYLWVRLFWAWLF